MSRIQAPAAVETHSIPPFFGSDSQILILGSFPSVKSRESGFYYGHPQNRFWRVLSSVFDAPLPQTIEQKQEFLRHSLYRALGCRRRMQHTRFGGQQYFGRYRKRYCSAPPFDANQSRFFKRSNGSKSFFANIFPKKPQNSAAPSRRCLQQAPQTHRIHSKSLLPNGAAQSAPSL